MLIFENVVVYQFELDEIDEICGGGMLLTDAVVIFVIYAVIVWFQLIDDAFDEIHHLDYGTVELVEVDVFEVFIAKIMLVDEDDELVELDANQQIVDEIDENDYIDIDDDEVEVHII